MLHVEPLSEIKKFQKFQKVKILLKNFWANPVIQRSNNGLFKWRKHPWVIFYGQIGGFLAAMFPIFPILPDSYKHLHLKEYEI